MEARSKKRGRGLDIVSWIPVFFWFFFGFFFFDTREFFLVGW